MTSIAARVGGRSVEVAEVDERERRLRDRMPAASLPLAGTSEGRQLRRWLTQLIVTERVVIAEAARLGVTATDAPSLDDVLPSTAARQELGSIAAAALGVPLARALFAYITHDVVVGDEEVASYHAGNPKRFARSVTGPSGWQVADKAPTLAAARPAIAAHLLGVARRLAFRTWLDTRRADLVVLAPGYEHPGDPRQPDNTHKH